MNDTHPAAEQVQLELLRQASPARRFALARSLSQSAVQLARRAIERRLSAADAHAVDVEFIRVHYGEELARRVSARLAG